MNAKASVKILEFGRPNRNYEIFDKVPTDISNLIPVKDKFSANKFVGLAKLDNLPDGLRATIDIPLNNKDELVSFEITNIQSEMFPRIFLTGEETSSTDLPDPYVVLNKPFTYFYKGEEHS